MPKTIKHNHSQKSPITVILLHPFPLDRTSRVAKENPLISASFKALWQQIKTGYENDRYALV